MKRNGLILALLLTAMASHAAYVELNNGRKIQGSRISVDASGTVKLTTATGQSMQFKQGQYKAAVADKPQAMDQALALAKDKKYAEAAALLKQIKTEYRLLGWDRKAAYALINILFADEKYAAAATEAEEYLKLGQDEKIGALYSQALLKSGDSTKLLPALNRDIAEGSREMAANAYLMRGDLKAAAGDKEGARLDWLKAATLFKAQKAAAQRAQEKLAE
ncbi:MAG: hypothetical protein K9M45_06670 [Kiritimatiellales bacterium]|nr:hypothetical protein [Kiritimatiellales bacterium]